jgi:hypothetical protein
MKYDKGTVLDTAMQIIKDEHEVFANLELDNDDYIPRIARIAESAGALLSQDGMAKCDVRANVNRIIAYGRRLFIQVWVSQMVEDGERPCEDEAAKEFDRYIQKEQKARRQRVRNCLE